MSDNKTAEGYLGTPVRLTKEVQEELELDWEEGIIASTFPTDTGLGIHVVNPETGAVSRGFGFEGVKLLPETIEGLRTLHKMQQAAMAQVAGMFDND